MSLRFEFQDPQKALREVRKNYDLLRNVTQGFGGEQEGGVDLSAIRKLIEEELPRELRDYAPPNFPELYDSFMATYRKFEEFIQYEQIIGKSVVALGGGFSSGKSSFINAILGEEALPEEVNPSTSVPTYIVHGEGEEPVVRGVNIFNARIRLTPPDLRHRIAHQFGEIKQDNGAVYTQSMSLGPILKSVFLSTQAQTYENIAFLDTPGYSKVDASGHIDLSDAKIAREQLTVSSYIIWFIQADKGTVTEDDINFIKSVAPKNPILVVVSKADTKPDAELKLIKESIQTGLSMNGIKTEAVLCFSSRTETVTQNGRAEILGDMEEIRKILSSWNQRVETADYAREFKKLFVQCDKYYAKENDEETRRLDALNKAALMIDSGELSEQLQRLIKELRVSKQNLSDTAAKLKELQTRFFTEIKRVADQVHIAMPEPSQIDLMMEDAADPLAVLQKVTGITKPDQAILSILRDTFRDVKPTLQRQPGGSEFSKVLGDVIRRNCSLTPEQIHFNDVYKSTELYQRLIQTIQNAIQTKEGDSCGDA